MPRGYQQKNSGSMIAYACKTNIDNNNGQRRIVVVGNNSDNHKRVAWLAEDIIRRKCHRRQKILMKESVVVSTN